MCANRLAKPLPHQLRVLTHTHAPSTRPTDTAQNTLFATSTCPDEVNYPPGEMLNLMQTRWGESFSLGGLGGVPFVGNAGFGAYAHHAPDEKGKMFIVFAPHVGIGLDGKIGALERLNQGGVSTACGAGIGAYNAILKDALKMSEEGEKKAAAPEAAPAADYFDAQIAFIKSELGPRLKGIEQASDPIAYVTYQMYALCREFFVDTILTASLWDEAQELAVLGGIQINRAEGGDFFMPLMFQTRTDKPGTSEDLFKETFGAPPPDLTNVFGDRRIARTFHDYDLDKKGARTSTWQMKLPQ